MKEFMFIFTGPTYEELNMSAEDAQAQMMKWFSWIDDLKAKGLYVEGRPLLPGSTRISGIEKVVTDGPFAESKEVVGGYLIIKAADRAQAVEAARGFPDFEIQGSVEIRDVLDVSADYQG
jgi:hypothetical protein